MLSGERFTSNERGTTTTRIAMPDTMAAFCQPRVSTSTPTMGANTRPPSPFPVDATDMANALRRRNHWFNAGTVALL